jgi:adenylate cyclase class 1
MVRRASELDFDEGLEPALLGVKDLVQEVREEAKNSLERLAQKATGPMKRTEELPPDLVIASAAFSFALFRELKVTRDFNLIRFYMELLLRTGGRGPFLAWKFFTHCTVPPNIVIEMIRKFPEILRLIFAHEYTKDRISVRQRHRSWLGVLMADVQDRHTVLTFLADVLGGAAFLDSLFEDLCSRLELRVWILGTALRSQKHEMKIKGLKALAALGMAEDYGACLPLLSPKNPPSVRLACLDVLACSNLRKDPALIEAIYPLLKDRDENISVHAFKALVALRAPALDRITLYFKQIHPTMVPKAYEILSDLDWLEMKTLLDALPPDMARDAKAVIVHEAVGKSSERFILFLKPYLKSSHEQLKKTAVSLLEQVDAMKEGQTQRSPEDRSDASLPDRTRKGLGERLARIKIGRGKKRLIHSELVEDAVFSGEIFEDLDLSGKRLRNVSFEGAVFRNVSFEGAKFHSVTFKEARFEKVNMNRASLDNVYFGRAVIAEMSGKYMSCSSCDFSNAWISDASFASARLQECLFNGTKIKTSDFSWCDLSESAFVGADLTRINFRFSNLDLSDFSLAQGKACDFSGVDLSEVSKIQACLQKDGDLSEGTVIPDLFFNEGLMDVRAFYGLLLHREMEKGREAFLKHNSRRIELALDTFRPDQGDLFELIPFLIHTDLALLPPDKPVEAAPSGISGYLPMPRILNLAGRHFAISNPPSINDKESCIEGLFTIGSVGTIAQSPDSDIDYWVCVNESALGDDGLQRLRAKLDAIEAWALETFQTEIHFFLVDLKRVRADRFGDSDQDSSGSAQGKILKEEFYRTMILVAGRIPLWCTTPSWVRPQSYPHLKAIASRSHNVSIDMGNVSTIPKSEYFGASIWQLVKSLKSPYKSVMKMSLLEKYIQEDAVDGLLCNRLKGVWSLPKTDLRLLDPYLLLFDEVLEYYQRTGEKKAASLLKVCFFLKLGIRSMSDLDKSVTGVRKKLVQDYISAWNWPEAEVQRLGHFREWPFERIFQLGTTISRYMIERYKKLSRLLMERTTVDGTMLTPQDLTILGRRMFVQFSKQPHKVEKLPFVVQGKSFFQQLQFQYHQTREGKPNWHLFHSRKGASSGDKAGDVLTKKERLEEIAIWLVYNGLYIPGISFQLLPNPTPISIQDILDLLHQLKTFFGAADFEEIFPQELLKNPRVRRLFLIVNFNLSRRLSRIYEYTAIYVTSWGELFCRVFSDKKGFHSLDDVIKRVKSQLEIPLSSGQTGFFVAREALKHIQGFAHDLVEP